MIRFRFPIQTALACVALLATSARADDAKPAAADPDLPQPLDLNAASPLLENSPLTREVDLSDTLRLTGIAYVKGQPMATLTNKRTKRNFVVTNEPNDLGWKLAEASPSTEPRYSQVKMYVNGELVTIRYGDAQLEPTRGAADAAKWKALTDKDIIRTDEKGKTYIRGSAYLSDADHNRYSREWSRESHDKYRQIIQDHRDYMFKASPEQRAAYSKKIFDSIDAQERAKTGK